MNSSLNINQEDMEWESTDSSLRNRESCRDHDDDDTSDDADSIQEEIKLRGITRPYSKINEFDNYTYFIG